MRFRGSRGRTGCPSPAPCGRRQRAECGLCAGTCADKLSPILELRKPLELTLDDAPPTRAKNGARTEVSTLRDLFVPTRVSAAGRPGGTIVLKGEDWCAIQNKTANSFVIEIALNRAPNGSFAPRTVNAYQFARRAIASSKNALMRGRRRMSR